MQIDLPDSAKILLYLFCGFIIAINLSLVFALRSRARDEALLRSKPKAKRQPWQSKIDDEAAELSKRMQELKDKSSKPPESS